ncbi:MAG: efflux transporter outer membrane subunit [Akkermansiaceae bacterium]
MKLNISVSLCFLLIFGCVAKAPESSIGVVGALAPSAWSATKEGKSGVDSNWVKRFGSSELNALVSEALASNQDMKIASERVFRAAEAAGIANALAKPQVSLSASGDRQKFNFIGFPFGGSQVSETYASNLSVSWELDIWGSYRAGKSAALADWQAGGQDFRAARASLASQVCKAWFTLAEANEQVSLARKALRVRKETEDAVMGRFERDMQAEGGSASQLRLSQTDVASAKADLSAKLGDLESAQRQLELLLGRYPSAQVAGKANLPSVPSSPPAGLPSELLLRRPDIMAAERRYAGSLKSIKEAQLAVFPSFSISGSGGNSSEALKNILDSSFGVWSIGADLAQPIVTGGRVVSEIKVRKSNQREALATLHQTVLKAFGEVEQALAAERWLKRRSGEMREAVKLARDAATAAEDDYRDGNGDVLTLFTAQSRSIQLDSQYASLRRLRLVNRVDLHLALGGGFNVSP